MSEEVYRALASVVGRYEEEVGRIIESSERLAKIGMLVTQLIMFTFLLAVIGIPVWKIVYMIRIPVIRITPEMAQAIYLLSTRLLAAWLAVDIAISTVCTFIEWYPPAWYLRLDGTVIMMLGIMGFSVSGNAGLLAFAMMGMATMVLMPIAEKYVREVTGKSLSEYLSTLRSLDRLSQEARRSLEEEIKRLLGG